jgi:hypothetical protein
VVSGRPQIGGDITRSQEIVEMEGVKEGRQDVGGRRAKGIRWRGLVRIYVM